MCRITSIVLVLLLAYNVQSGEVKWCSHPEHFLMQYADGVHKYDTLAEAQAQCLLRTVCGGVTQDIKKAKYTLRKGSNLKKSTTGNVNSWVVCTPVTCTKPDVKEATIAPADATIAEGAKYTVTCMKGYTLSGNKEVTCSDTGKLSTLPTCAEDDSVEYSVSVTTSDDDEDAGSSGTVSVQLIGDQKTTAFAAVNTAYIKQGSVETVEIKSDTSIGVVRCVALKVDNANAYLPAKVTVKDSMKRYTQIWKYKAKVWMSTDTSEGQPTLKLCDETCGPGTHVSPDKKSCVPCELNTFNKDVENAASCTPCSGVDISGTAATECFAVKIQSIEVHKYYTGMSQSKYTISLTVDGLTSETYVWSLTKGGADLSGTAGYTPSVFVSPSGVNYPTLDVLVAKATVDQTYYCKVSAATNNIDHDIPVLLDVYEVTPVHDRFIPGVDEAVISCVIKGLTTPAKVSFTDKAGDPVTDTSQNYYDYAFPSIAGNETNSTTKEQTSLLQIRKDFGASLGAKTTFTCVVESGKYPDSPSYSADLVLTRLGEDTIQLKDPVLSSRDEAYGEAHILIDGDVNNKRAQLKVSGKQWFKAYFDRHSLVKQIRLMNGFVTNPEYKVIHGAEVYVINEEEDDDNQLVYCGKVDSEDSDTISGNVKMYTINCPAPMYGKGVYVYVETGIVALSEIEVAGTKLYLSPNNVEYKVATATVTCTVYSYDETETGKGEVSWVVDGETYTEDSTSSVYRAPSGGAASGTTFSATLEIKKPYYDSKTFTCKVKFATSKSVLENTITQNTYKPYLTAYSETTGYLGTTLTVTCDVINYYPKLTAADVDWYYKSQKQGKANQKFTYDKSTRRKQRALFTAKISATGMGVYKCEITLYGKLLEKETLLTVKDPSVTVEEENVIGQSGLSMTFYCQTENYGGRITEADVVWKAGSKVITKTDPDYSVELDVNERSYLTVKRVPTWTTVYTCSIQMNKKMSKTVTVKGWTIIKSALAVEMGAKVTLSCKLTVVKPKEGKSGDPSDKWRSIVDNCYAGSLSDQRDYRGSISTTQSGQICQRWTSQIPHPHPHAQKDKMAGLGLGDHNYCRNPSNKRVGAWCYTTDPDEEWENCAVPSCGDWVTSKDSTVTWTGPDTTTLTVNAVTSPSTFICAYTGGYTSNVHVDMKIKTISASASKTSDDVKGLIDGLTDTAIKTTVEATKGWFKVMFVSQCYMEGVIVVNGKLGGTSAHVIAATTVHVINNDGDEELCGTIESTHDGVTAFEQTYRVACAKKLWGRAVKITSASASVPLGLREVTPFGYCSSQLEAKEATASSTKSSSVKPSEVIDGKLTTSVTTKNGVDSSIQVELKKKAWIREIRVAQKDHSLTGLEKSTTWVLNDDRDDNNPEVFCGRVPVSSSDQDTYSQIYDINCPRDYYGYKVKVLTNNKKSLSVSLLEVYGVEITVPDRYVVRAAAGTQTSITCLLKGLLEDPVDAFWSIKQSGVATKYVSSNQLKRITIGGIQSIYSALYEGTNVYKYDISGYNYKMILKVDSAPVNIEHVFNLKSSAGNTYTTTTNFIDLIPYNVVVRKAALSSVTISCVLLGVPQSIVKDWDPAKDTAKINWKRVKPDSSFIDVTSSIGTLREWDGTSTMKLTLDLTTVAVGADPDTKFKCLSTPFDTPMERTIEIDVFTLTKGDDVTIKEGSDVNLECTVTKATLSTDQFYWHQKTPQSECEKEDYDYQGGDITGAQLKVASLAACIALCQNRAECKSITYRPSATFCWLKNSDNGSNLISGAGLVSVTMSCLAPKLVNKASYSIVAGKNTLKLKAVSADTKYTCVVKGNDNSPEYSEVVTVDTFKMTTKNIAIQVGATAKLECTIEGIGITPSGYRFQYVKGDGKRGEVANPKFTSPTVSADVATGVITADTTYYCGIDISGTWYEEKLQVDVFKINDANEMKVYVEKSETTLNCRCDISGWQGDGITVNDATNVKWTTATKASLTPKSGNGWIPSLKISFVTVSNPGVDTKYTCAFEIESVWYEATVGVYVFTLNSHNVHVESGSTTTISCTVETYSGDTSIFTREWRNVQDVKESAGNEKWTVVNEETVKAKTELKITSAITTDTTYTCSIMVGGNWFSKKVAVDVFDVVGKAAVYESGSAHTITCTVQGYSGDVSSVRDANVAWKKGAASVSTPANSWVFSRNDLVLPISAGTDTADTSYTCRFKTPDPADQWFDGVVTVDVFEVKYDPDKYVRRGSAATISCTIDGFKGSEVANAWTNAKGVGVADNSMYKQDWLGERSSANLLKISSVDADTTYTCNFDVAYNKVAKVINVWALYLTTSNVIVELGTKASLTCKLNGNGGTLTKSDVQWRDASGAPVSADLYTWDQGSTTTTLQVETNSITDTTYTCKVTARSVVMEKTVHVDIFEWRAHGDVTVVNAEWTLSCVLDGYTADLPKTDIKWISATPGKTAVTLQTTAYDWDDLTYKTELKRTSLNNVDDVYKCGVQIAGKWYYKALPLELFELKAVNDVVTKDDLTLARVLIEGLSKFVEVHISWYKNTNTRVPDEQLTTYTYANDGLKLKETQDVTYTCHVDVTIGNTAIIRTFTKEVKIDVVVINSPDVFTTNTGNTILQCEVTGVNRALTTSMWNQEDYFTGWVATKRGYESTNKKQTIGNTHIGLITRIETDRGDWTCRFDYKLSTSPEIMRYFTGSLYLDIAEFIIPMKNYYMLPGENTVFRCQARKGNETYTSVSYLWDVDGKRQANPIGANKPVGSDGDVSTLTFNSAVNKDNVKVKCTAVYSSGTAEIYSSGTWFVEDISVLPSNLVYGVEKQELVLTCKYTSRHARDIQILWFKEGAGLLQHSLPDYDIRSAVVLNNNNNNKLETQLLIKKPDHTYSHEIYTCRFASTTGGKIRDQLFELNYVMRIIEQPETQDVLSGYTATFKVDVTNYLNDVTEIKYAWYRENDSTAQKNTAEPVFETPQLLHTRDSNAKYYCEVTWTTAHQVLKKETTKASVNIRDSCKINDVTNAQTTIDTDDTYVEDKTVVNTNCAKGWILPTSAADKYKQTCKVHNTLDDSITIQNCQGGCWVDKVLRVHEFLTYAVFSLTDDYPLSSANFSYTTVHHNTDVHKECDKGFVMTSQFAKQKKLCAVFQTNKGDELKFIPCVKGCPLTQAATAVHTDVDLLLKPGDTIPYNCIENAITQNGADKSVSGVCTAESVTEADDLPLNDCFIPQFKRNPGENIQSSSIEIYVKEAPSHPGRTIVAPVSYQCELYNSGGKRLLIDNPVGNKNVCIFNHLDSKTEYSYDILVTWQLGGTWRSDRYTFTTFDKSQKVVGETAELWQASVVGDLMKLEIPIVDFAYDTYDVVAVWFANPDELDYYITYNLPRPTKNLKRSIEIIKIWTSYEELKDSGDRYGAFFALKNVSRANAKYTNLNLNHKTNTPKYTYIPTDEIDLPYGVHFLFNTLVCDGGVDQGNCVSGSSVSYTPKRRIAPSIIAIVVATLLVLGILLVCALVVRRKYGKESPRQKQKQTVSFKAKSSGSEDHISSL